MGEFDCHYMLDGQFCEGKFLHDGDHHFLSALNRTITWLYPSEMRDRDRQIGYPACGHFWSEGNKVCNRIINHADMHSDLDEVSWEGRKHAEVPYYCWSDEVDSPQSEPSTEKAERPVSPGVQAALDARKADPSLRKVAIRLEGGSVARYDVVAKRIFDSGMLSLETTEGDITYAPGAWRSITAEPVPREDD